HPGFGLDHRDDRRSSGRPTGGTIRRRHTGRPYDYNSCPVTQYPGWRHLSRASTPFMPGIRTMNSSVGETPVVWSPAFRRSGPAKAWTPNGGSWRAPVRFFNAFGARTESSSSSSSKARHRIEEEDEDEAQRPPDVKHAGGTPGE